MPEGPEVKRFVDQLNHILDNSILTKIKIISGRYAKHSKPDGWDAFEQLLPLKIDKINCKGKFIYWTFQNTESNMWNTLGMTGSWGIHPDHKRVEFSITDSNGISHSVYFSDIRNFGTLKFSNSKNELTKKLDSIGPDMLSDPPDFDLFKQLILNQGSKNLCKAIMDQSVISGVGNYVKAEALYLSKISPHRDCSSLSGLDISNLYKSIRSILAESYSSGGSTLKTYKDLYGNLGSYSGRFLVYGKKNDPAGNPVMTVETQDGRTTHWVPLVQV
jgi:DNA-formamidopyrimidine glycosylase